MAPPSCALWFKLTLESCPTLSSCGWPRRWPARSPKRPSHPSRTSSRASFETRRAYRWRRWSQINVPFVVFHGLGDRLTSPAASEAAFRQAKSQDKTLFQYEQAEHAILSDSLDTKQRFLDDILTWLEDRTAPGRKETTLASLPINAGAVRPPGPEVFSAPGNPLNVFDLTTHPEIYASTHPKNEAEVLPAQNALLTVL